MGTLVFLCSSDSDFMTGQAIVVDRGSIFHGRCDHGKRYQWAHGTSNLAGPYRRFAVRMSETKLSREPAVLLTRSSRIENLVRLSILDNLSLVRPPAPSKFCSRSYERRIACRVRLNSKYHAPIDNVFVITSSMKNATPIHHDRLPGHKSLSEEQRNTSVPIKSSGVCSRLIDLCEKTPLAQTITYESLPP